MAPKDPVPAENGEVSLSCVAAAEEFEDVNLRGLVEVCINSGDEEFRKKEYRSAIQSYTEGIEAYCTDKELNAELFSKRATTHCFLGNYTEALSDANASRERNPSCTRAYTAGGKACLMLNKFEEAIKWCDDGLAIDWDNKALLELKKESLIKQSEQSPKGISTKSHHLKLDIAKNVAGSSQGRCCLELGDIYSQARNFEKAVEYYQRYLHICRDEENRVGEADVYGKLGNVFNRVGKFEEAIENYRLQLRFAMEDGNRSQEAQALESLGNLYLFHSQFGDLKTAVDYLERSLKVFIELDDKSGIGHAYGYLGIAFHRLGDLKTALNYHQKNLTIVMQLDEKAEEGKTYGNIGRVYRSRCDFNQAINYHELQLSIARNKTRKVDEAIARYDLACNYESLADSARESPTESIESPAESRESPAEFRQSQAEYLTQAREHYQLCAKLLNDVRPRHRGIAQNSTFNDEWKINLFDEYKHVYSDLCRVLSKVHLNWEALLEADKGRAQALRDYMESRYQIETVQPFSSEQDGTASDIYGDIQANTVYLAIDTDTINVWLLMPGHEVRFEKRPLHITSNAVDFLRTLIANAYSRCNVFVPLRGFHGSLQLGGNSLDDEESNLSDQSTVLGIDELGKKEGEIGSSFLSDRSPLQDEEEFNLSDKSTTHDIENLDQKEKHTGSSFLLDGSPLHDDEELNQSDKSTAHDIEKLGHQETMIGQVNPLRTLYDVIFGPIIDHLQGDEIVIVPEGPLCLAPFAAFVAPDSRFLCESFRIRVIPSLASLKLISQGDHSESGALLVGDPDVQEVVRIGGTQVVLNPLPFARKEVLMIGRLLNIEPVIGATATKMEVLDRMTSAALIHIAAHASSESGEIALTPNPTRPFQVPNEEDFLLTMAEILNVQVRAQLVVLSCCHSGRGEIRAEGVVGIVRGFLAAGARSVLVTLWAIDDEVTLMFMEIFYDHLVKGRSSCEALNEAMRHLRESDSFSDVRHWAPFVLIGDDVTLTLPL